MGELTVWIVLYTVAIRMYRQLPMVPLDSCLTAAACLSSACYRMFIRCIKSQWFGVTSWVCTMQPKTTLTAFLTKGAGYYSYSILIAWQEKYYIYIYIYIKANSYTILAILSCILRIAWNYNAIRYLILYLYQELVHKSNQNLIKGLFKLSQSNIHKC